MLRLVIFVFLVIIVYKLLSGLIKGLKISDNQRVSTHQSTADLVQDPQCGAYILPAQGVSTKVGGKTYHFCSDGCRNKFLLAQSEKTNEKTG